MNTLPISADSLSSEFFSFAEKHLREKNSCVDEAILRIASAILIVPVCAAIDLALNVLACVTIVPLFFENGLRHITNVAAAIALFVKAPFLLFGAPFPQPTIATVPVSVPTPQNTQRISKKLFTLAVREVLDLVAEKNEALAKEMKKEGANFNLHYANTAPPGAMGRHNNCFAITWAIRNDYTEITDKMLAAGANMNPLTDPSPVQEAMRHQHYTTGVPKEEPPDLAFGEVDPKVNVKCLKTVLKYIEKMNKQTLDYAFGGAILDGNAPALQELVLAANPRGKCPNIFHSVITTAANLGWRARYTKLFEVLIKHEVGLYALHDNMTIMRHVIEMPDAKPEERNNKLNLIVQMLIAGILPEPAAGNKPSTVDVLRKDPLKAAALIAHQKAQMDAMDAQTQLPKELLSIISGYINSVDTVIKELQPTPAAT